MQYMWKYALPFLPKLKKQYDVAISYLWPHYFVADKVNAKTKIAWIHTDYSKIDTDIEVDLDMWNKFDYIAAVSKAKTKIAWIHTDYSKIDTDIEVDLDMWNKFDYIAAVSKDCKNAFLSKYPSLKEKVIIIENITSPNFVRSMAEESVDDFDTEEDVFNVVSVGRYCDAKGFDNAIKALRILHDRGYTNIKWYVVGYGSDEELYKRLIKENNLEDSFILLGKKTNPYPYMKNCDLYAQPSRYEGKAVTVSEAQILGKAVMLTNYTTAHSQVRDGIDGYITELSIEGIANGIEKLSIDRKLRVNLEDNCQKYDYSNVYELNKLYEII